MDLNTSAVRVPEVLACPLREAGIEPERIVDVAEDSRQVVPGGLFAALPGRDRHGLEFAADAKARGAVGVISDRAGPAAGLPVVTTTDPRADLALLCRALAGPLPAKRIAVTGTRGKSSTLAYWRQLLALSGIRVGSVGSLGLQTGADECRRQPITADGYEFTTPPVSVLYRNLRKLREEGCTHVGVEASSQGLAQERLRELDPSAAGWTDFTPAHQECHGSVAAYFAAKNRLIAETLRPASRVVVGRRFPGLRRVEETCRRRGHRLVRADDGADGFHLRAAEERLDRLRLSVAAGGRDRAVDVPLLGAWQAVNLAVAVHLALPEIAGGPDAVIDLLPRLRMPVGRMEKLAEGDGGRIIFSDYCSLPGAYAGALRFARRLAGRRLFVVFGCDGGRDPRIRPKIGRIVAQRADAVWLTDLNPGAEDPAEIRAGVLAGLPGANPDWHVVPDRGEAVRRAVRAAGDGDVVLLAGKGHEGFDLRADGPVRQTDRELARAAVGDAGPGWRTV
ncbi:MAG: Mur ligase family protein [Puniceicoccaceae bacterium]